MDIRSYTGDKCYLVWENDVLAHGRQGGWININRDLGEK